MLAWRKNNNSVDAREEMRETTALIMDLRSSRNKVWMSAVAWVLIICFINQDIVWAQSGTPVWVKQSSANTPAKTDPAQHHPLSKNH